MTYHTLFRAYPRKRRKHFPVKKAIAFIESLGFEFIKSVLTPGSRERIYIFFDKNRPDKQIELFTDAIRYHGRMKKPIGNIYYLPRRISIPSIDNPTES